MSNSKERILVFRFSSMGDVAMTAPVLKEFSEQNPNTEVLIVSRPLFKPFFSQIPNATFIGVTLENYKGIWGLKKLASQLLTYKPTMVADLHNVLRTKILKLFLSFSLTKIKTLDKGRAEKKALIRKEHKILTPLRPMTERYADVFRSLGFTLKLSHQLQPTEGKREKTIGIAPFAKYQEKTYPLEKMQNLCLDLAQEGNIVYLFGGKEEAEVLEKWANLHPNIQSLAAKISLEEEMNFISTLTLMISMDSANMHIASLVNTRVISIWGSTHPYAGFLGYGQEETDVIQCNLECRPCSIFGNKPCYRKDLACLNNLDELEIKKNILSKIL